MFPAYHEPRCTRNHGWKDRVRARIESLGLMLLDVGARVPFIKTVALRSP